MFRAVAYLALGWFLLAVVGGLADVLDLTVMLPATSAIVLTHAAFSRNPSTVVGLALAVSIGYLEDLYQGAPVGTLSLAYALGFLALRWVAARVALTGWVMRAVACVAAVVVLDLLTWGILMALAARFAGSPVSPTR